ncbi:Uncharacterised protein [Serratia ficaria]|uniref:Uncharacterized protein n=1 Tax=Serratia ficaria TaxID=61651 RepID=A0A240CBE0_SERFI|nr:hypothetical protein C7332_1672 [Serratia ficaria]CAI0693592.1 Uncharacterised protein [Serratia ficaria]CAI1111678.1 Uncharacterised protein [Serratia ficaria]CAI1131363.1 Uncharacterised protein [Serratia ficaria]CAI2085312.1 Uncharacterised protein [Serratia ficaria]
MVMALQPVTPWAEPALTSMNDPIALSLAEIHRVMAAAIAVMTILNRPHFSVR